MHPDLTIAVARDRHVRRTTGAPVPLRLIPGGRADGGGRSSRSRRSRPAA